VGDDGRRAAILAEMLGSDRDVSARDMVGRVCRFSVDRLDLSGCALLLIAGADVVETLAIAGPQSGEIADLQFSLAEGPCLEAHRSGLPVLVPDLSTEHLRWPAFAPAAADLGVRAEFSLPLVVGAAGLGTLDMSRNEPGMLADDELSDALVAADIATDALLILQDSDDSDELAKLLEADGTDRLIVHQATGVLSVKLDVSPSDALASLRARAFRTGRPLHEIATDVVNRRVDIDD
jgi:GAF domain-containing protein